MHCNFSYFSIKTNVYNTTADSHLYLGMASAADSGTYSCNVADLASARLSLHILNGKKAKKFTSSFKSGSKIYGEGWCCSRERLVVTLQLSSSASRGRQQEQPTFEFSLMTWRVSDDDPIQFTCLFFTKLCFKERTTTWVEQQKWKERVHLKPLSMTFHDHISPCWPLVRLPSNGILWCGILLASFSFPTVVKIPQ